MIAGDSTLQEEVPDPTGGGGLRSFPVPHRDTVAPPDDLNMAVRHGLILLILTAGIIAVVLVSKSIT